MSIGVSSIFYLLFLSTVLVPAKTGDTNASSVIFIRQVGDVDKMIAPIIISDTAEGALGARKLVSKHPETDLIWTYVVTKQDLTGLLIAINSSSVDTSEQVGRFDRFAVETITLDGSHRVVHGKASTIALLSQMQTACSDENLRAGLKRLEAQIRNN